MTRAISDDEILALYEQPWLGYEEYGRTLISIPAPAGNVPDRTTGVELDGSTEYFNRGALVGAGDTKTLTLSTWLKVQSAGLAQVWFSRANGSFHGMINIFTHPSNGFSVVVNEVGTTNKVFNVDATSAVFDTLTDGNWHHVMFSGNAAATTFTLWVDGVKITAFSNSGAFDRTIDWTVPDHWIGADYNLASKYNGCIGEFYLTNEYLDFDVAANRLKFRAANGGPADLGANGSTPTGTQPLVYLSGGASQFADNFGSGGAFTVNGTPIDCPIDLGVTVTPAGVNAAGAPGTLAALGAAVHQLSGTAATGAPGSLTALGAAVQALTGVAGSGAIGVLSITGEALVVPFGTAATGAAGTVIVETAGGATVELSGVATAAAPGQLNVTGAAAVALAGVLAQGQVGTLFIAGEAVAQLEGVAGAGQVGLVSIDEGAGGIAVTISGVAITGLAGDVTAQGAAQLTLGGVSVTGTAGGLTLIIPTETTPENRVLIIEADDRTLIIAADGRTLTIH